MKKQNKKHIDGINKATYEIQEWINNGKINKTIDVGKINNGYHTFDDLYLHRQALFIALCKQIAYDFTQPSWNSIWRSKLHSDGSKLDGYFILGISDIPKKMITYHLPLSYWIETDFAKTLRMVPPFDGHTPEDVLNRLKNL